MQNVLADLCVESEAATALALRLARAYDEEDTAFKRLATAIGKYWVCKRLPGHAFEAMECLGGNGYVEESGMPRLYREAPLNSIWEGSGNVNALDVLRALVKQPETLERYLAEVGEAAGADARLDAFVGDAEGRVRRPDDARDPRAPRRRAPRARAAGLAARPPRAARGRRRVLRVAPGRRRRPGLRDAAGGHRLPRDHRAPHAGARLTASCGRG